MQPPEPGSSRTTRYLPDGEVEIVQSGKDEDFPQVRLDFPPGTEIIDEWGVSYSLSGIPIRPGYFP